MASDGLPGNETQHVTHNKNTEPSVYTISGLYSKQVPPSEDSEVTESVCTSTCEFVNAHERNSEFSPYMLCQPTIDTCNSSDCGICKLRPRCLQRFANIKVFVFLCCILVTLQQTLSSGYLNSVITTIEKRFDITSGLSGAIASTYEIGNLITIIFVSYLGSRRHIPVWLAVGVILMGIGSIVFVLPQFITERYTVEGQISRNDTLDNICRAASISETYNGFLTSPADGTINHWCSKGHSSNGLAVVIFMIAQLLIGCGGSPLFTLGTTYIDDHVKRESAAMYIGCLYSMVAFGPVCGFLLGGYLLSFYVDGLSYDTEELNINPSDPRWVGAWWGGFLIIGCLLIVFSLPVFAFPKRLRHTRQSVLIVNEKGYTTAYTESLPPTSSVSVESSNVLSDDTYSMPSKSKDESYGSSVRDIPRSMMRLICNPVYIVTCFGSCMELVIVSGFVVFLPKYLETQFSIGKSQANMFTGGIAIPGACFGIFIGGYFLKRFQLKPKGAVQFVLICNVICLIFYCVLFFLGCDNVRMAGATMPYSNSSQTEKFQVNLTAMCNMGCECSPNDISPICGSNGITYFSPCHAGCTTRARTHSNTLIQDYTDCKCITANQSTDAFQEVTIVPVATNGPCAHFCYTITPFMILLFLMSLVVSITQMPLLMIVLRSVDEQERSFALGMQFVIFRLFGYIPSPIVFGNVIDSTCLLWKAHCNARGGFCLMYDIEKFRYKYVGICAGIKVVAGILFLLDWFLIRQCCSRNKDFTITMADVVSSIVSLDKVCQEQDLKTFALASSANAENNLEGDSDITLMAQDQASTSPPSSVTWRTDGDVIPLKPTLSYESSI